MCVGGCDGLAAMLCAGGSIRGRRQGGVVARGAGTHGDGRGKLQLTRGGQF